ncbi:MAG: DUF192 domain-containing protein [Anaerolineaceae bacterium]
MKTQLLINPASPTEKIQIIYCDNFLSRLKGLMFSKQIPLDQGILLAESKESKVDTSIHMMFMNFNITALWLNKNFVIVDKVLAKKWHPVYFPKVQAQYVVELHADQFPNFSIGDQLLLQDFQ